MHDTCDQCCDVIKNSCLSYACGLKRLESWRQCVASGWAGRFRAWLGDGVGTAGRGKDENQQISGRCAWKRKYKITGDQTSPGGPPMVGKDMDPVICRACWAAGGIFRPVPGGSKRSHLHDSQQNAADLTLKQNKPSASRAMSCRRPVVPRSIPVLSSSSLSRMELAVDESERSVTWPTFIGRPASSKPFSCSKAFFAHSASAN